MLLLLRLLVLLGAGLMKLLQRLARDVKGHARDGGGDEACRLGLGRVVPAVVRPALYDVVLGMKEVSQYMDIDIFNQLGWCVCGYARDLDV